MTEGAPLDEEAFFELSGDLLAVCDESLKLLKVNQAWREQLWYERESVVGRSLLEIIAPRDRERVESLLQAACTSNSTRSFDAALVRRNQQLRAAHFVVSPHSAARRMYVVARDVTVRKRLETELASAQKLQAIGQLASGIAHEINTPMQFIGDNLGFLGDTFLQVLPLFQLLAATDLDAPLSEDARTQLRVARVAADLPYVIKEVPLAIASGCEGVERVAQLVRSLREFAHADSGRRELTDLNRAIERTIAVARSEWKYEADVTTDLHELPMVRCHPSAINQVLLNLLCNAAQAIAEKRRKRGAGTPKGTIRVVTRRDEHLAIVEVHDTGCGIPEAVRKRVFEPFFTTKEVGKGTGQGLSISRTIVVEQHQGRLEFESEEGRGTTFFLRLPVDTSFGESE